MIIILILPSLNGSSLFSSASERLQWMDHTGNNYEGGGELNILGGRFLPHFCIILHTSKNFGQIFFYYLAVLSQYVIQCYHSIPSGTLVGINPGMMSSYEIMTFGGMR